MSSARAKLSEVAPGVDGGRMSDAAVEATLKALTGQSWKRVDAAEQKPKKPKAPRKPVKFVRYAQVARTNEDGSRELTVLLPLRSENEPNLRENWRATARRSRQQVDAVRKATEAWLGRIDQSRKLDVTLTRIAPGHMDPTGAVASLKHVQDAVAWVAFGCQMKRVTTSGVVKFVPALGDDDDDPRFVWHYGQKHSPAYGVEIKVVAR